MPMLFSILVATAFGLACLFAAFTHSRSAHSMTLLAWALLAIGGVYGFGWALVSLATATGLNAGWSEWLLPKMSAWPVHSLFAAILAVSIGLGWRLLSPRNRSRRSLQSNGIPVGHWVFLFLGLLIAAFIAQVIYADAYGGLGRMYAHASSIRQGLSDVRNPWSFLQPLNQLALFASLGFFGLLLQWRKSDAIVRAVAGLGLLLATAFTIELLQISKGLVNMALYGATLGLGVLLFLRLPPAKIFVAGALALVGVVLTALLARLVMSDVAQDGVFRQIAAELSFPFVGFFSWLGEPVPYRWFADYLALPLFLLPSSLWTDWILPITQMNTEQIHGVMKGENGHNSGMPTDLITVGMLQAPWGAGVVFVGVFFGGLLRACQTFLDRIEHQGLNAIMTAHVALYVACKNVFYAQPDGLIEGNFALIITAVCIWLLTRTPFRARALSRVNSTDR